MKLPFSLSDPGSTPTRTGGTVMLRRIFHSMLPFVSLSLAIAAQTAIPIHSPAADSSVPGQNVLAETAAAPSVATPAPDVPSDVRLGSGDLLTVNLAGVPDYRYDVRVSSSGDVSLPMVGNMKVAGLTTSQAETAIGNELQSKGFFNEPHVSVFVKEYATSGTSVLGEVQHPGIYTLLGQRTLLDAISAAGGTTGRAGRKVTITHRGHPEQTESISLAGADGQMTNIKVSPGDTIVVSKAGVVYVVGDVKEPTGIVLDNPRLTVLQALSMAHGINPTAALGSAKIIRNVSGTSQEIPIPLKKILSAKDPDPVLQADDIVFVPNSAAKTATRRGLDAALQAATGVAIYGRY